MRSFSSLALVLAFASITLSCGSASNGRQLQSITIIQSANGQQFEFVATGTFSAAPRTVTPLPVFWSIDLPPNQYVLTSQPFSVTCNVSGPYPGPIVAWAPENPSAPGTGNLSGTKMVTGSTSITCP